MRWRARISRVIATARRLDDVAARREIETWLQVGDARAASSGPWCRARARSRPGPGPTGPGPSAPARPARGRAGSCTRMIWPDRVLVGEQRARDGGAEQADLVGHLARRARVKLRAVGDQPVADRQVVLVAALDLGVPVLVAGDHLGAAAHARRAGARPSGTCARWPARRPASACCVVPAPAAHAARAAAEAARTTGR